MRRRQREPDVWEHIRSLRSRAGQCWDAPEYIATLRFDQGQWRWAATAINFLQGSPNSYTEIRNAFAFSLVRDGCCHRGRVGTQCRYGRCTGNCDDLQGRNYQRHLGAWRVLGSRRYCVEGDEAREDDQGRHDGSRDSRYSGEGGSEAGEGIGQRGSDGELH